MELIISGPSHIRSVSAALQTAHAIAAGSLNALKSRPDGHVVFLGSLSTPRQVTAIERNLGLNPSLSWFWRFDGGLGTMTHAIERCKEGSTGVVVLEPILSDCSPLAGDGEGANPCVKALQDACRSEGWTLILCRVIPSFDEQSDQVRHALCEKCLHESVRSDEVGIKVYDIEDARLCADLPRLEPGQVALEFPSFDGGPIRPQVYDMATLLRALELVTPGSYEGWDDDDMDAVDWEALQDDLTPALASQVSRDPS